MEDEVHQLIMQFITNDKQAIEWHKEGKISFDSMVKMKEINSNNFVKVLSEFAKFNT